MKTKCYSVRLESLVSISDLAYKARAFDGSEAILPKSRVFGPDHDVQKSEAYWIAEWILGKVDLQYSAKKEAYFDTETRNMLPTWHIEHHKPERKQPVNIEPHAELTK